MAVGEPAFRAQHGNRGIAREIGVDQLAAPANLPWRQPALGAPASGYASILVDDMRMKGEGEIFDKGCRDLLGIDDGGQHGLGQPVKNCIILSWPNAAA